MHKIKLFFIYTVFSFSTHSVKAEEPSYITDGIVEYYCNAKKSYFAFYADSPKIKQGYKKQKVEISPLLITSKEDSFGNYKRLGSKKAIHQCGTIKATFESGYYNANIQGELGLMDYPLMSITIDGKKILDKSVLNLCASGGARAVCPTDFSLQSIEINQISRNLYQIVLTKALPVNNGDNFKLKKEDLKLKIK